MLKFRPHHFLCTLGFEGKGYSREFVRRYLAIAGKLRVPVTGDQQMIEVTRETDDICSPCPHRRDHQCESESRIRQIDDAHAEILGIRAGDVLSWGEAKERIRKRMSLAKFEVACSPCEWKNAGMCRKALQKLHREDGEREKPGSRVARIFVAAIGLGLSAGTFGSHSAFAQSQDKFASIDLIHQKLDKKPKSPQAFKVKKALNALSAKRLNEAIATAGSLFADPMYSDYGYAIAAAAHYERASINLAAKQYLSAISSAKHSIDLHLKIESQIPDSPLGRFVPERLAQSEFVAALAYAAKGDHSSAQKFFERGFQRVSSPNRIGIIRPDILAQYAKSCKIARTPLCDSWIQRFSQAYPKTSEEIKAIAVHAPEVKNQPRSPVYETRPVKKYKLPDADFQAFDQALALYLDGQFDDAASAFKKILEEYPNSSQQFRTKFWLGRSLEKEGDKEKAAKIYGDLARESPLTYYGMLAARAGDVDLEKSFEGILPKASDQDDFLKPEEILGIRRAEQLIRAKAYELAALELRSLRARSGLSSQYLMYLASLNHRVGNFSTSFSILGELIQRGYEGVFSTYALRLIFPLTRLDLIRKFASTHQLDPILVLSLVKQESAFDGSAISHAGATGLMQLMPATALDTEPDVLRSQLSEPETNIRLGTKYLRRMLNTFNSIAMALAAYNAGPGAVKRWIREGKTKHGLLEFIEQIPYKETREYVAAIIRNHFWYSRKLSSDGPKSLDYFWNSYGPSEPMPTFPEEVKPHPVSLDRRHPF